MTRTRFSAALCGILSFGLIHCGQDRSRPASAPALPPIQAGMQEVSSTYRIPQDILLAIAHKEANLSPDPSTTQYQNSQIGPSLAQTLVGLPRAELGLEELAGTTQERRHQQLMAYGRWVSENLAEERLDLPTTLGRADDVYDWVWQLARMHYPSSPKNVQILFALELIRTLNEGFIWQDPESNERIELKPHTPKLLMSSFSPTVQANLLLDTRPSELFFIDYLQLNYKVDGENFPRQIRVIHCPFTLTTCLGTQLQSDKDAIVPMQAHYIIPPDDSLLPRPIKVLQHRNSVTLTDENGNPKPVNDAVVIMLVGQSGRIIQGERTQTNPSWYTKYQLKNLGKIIQGVCQQLPKESPGVNPVTCQEPGVGVQFADPALHNLYKYGDIPDYDSAIFGSFVRNPDNLSGEVSIQLSGSQKLYAAGTTIPVTFQFIKGTAKLEVQRLERCASGKTVWTTLQTMPLKSVDQKSIEITLFDQGPNKNGQQFIRALAYGSSGELMGWAVKDFFLSDFDREYQVGPNLTQCN